MKQLLLFISGLHLCLIAAAAFPTWRRQEVDPTCTNQENAVGICRPSSNDVWYNGSMYEISWNYNNPAFITDENVVNLYLLYRSANGTYETVKKWDDVPRQPGAQVAQVDDSWFPTPLPGYSPNKTWTPYFFVVTDGFNVQEEIQDSSTFPPPAQFTLIQNAKNTTLASPSPAPTTPAAGQRLAGWMIAVIVIAATLLLMALGALLFFCIRHRNKRQNQPAPKQPLAAEDQATITQRGKPMTPTGAASPRAIPRPFSAHDLSSISSMSPITGPRGEGSPSALSPTQPLSEIQSFPQQQLQQQQQTPTTVDPMQSTSSILSSTDAIMIADTFRQFMRKPEWTSHEHPDEEDDDDDDENDTFRPVDENEQRKRLGDELLRKELAEEGTSVHQVERRPGRCSSSSRNQDD